MTEQSITYVYFIKNELTGHVKIGVADDVSKRLATFQTANSGDLIVLTTIAYPSRTAAFIAEYEFHVQFSERKVRGEWFDKVKFSEILPESEEEFARRERALEIRNAELQTQVRVLAEKEAALRGREEVLRDKIKSFRGKRSEAVKHAALKLTKKVIINEMCDGFDADKVISDALVNNRTAQRFEFFRTRVKELEAELVDVKAGKV